jgi:hypothetical protein
MSTSDGRRTGVGLMGATLAALLVGLVAVTIGAGGPAGASRSGSGSGSAPGSVRAELTRAKTEILVKSDLPRSWKGRGSVSTDNGTSPDTFPGEDQLAGCLGVAKSILEQNAPSVTSPDFENPAQTDYAQENLSIFATAKEGQVQYASLANPKVPACMTALLGGAEKSEIDSSFPTGSKVGTITVTSIPRADLAPQATGFLLSFPVTDQGVTLQTSIGEVVSVRGTAGVQLTFTSIGPRFPASLEKHLVTVAYDRS